MCDCNDDINNGSIPIGPTGPEGPTGPSGLTGSPPDISGDSADVITIGMGNKTFTVDSGIAWSTGQRLRVSNDDATKVMEGPIVSYTGTTLIINVDKVIGSGDNNDWNISITGSIGATGSTGSTGATGSPGTAGVGAFTTLTLDNIPLGGTVYQLEVGNSSWMSIGQIIFIKDAGYYLITSISSTTRIITDNLMYPGNNTANLLSGKTVSAAGLRGVAGSNGTNGTDGFIYETTDGNLIATEATDAYQLLMRNSDNTGYTFVSLSDLKILLASV